MVTTAPHTTQGEKPTASPGATMLSGMITANTPPKNTHAASSPAVSAVNRLMHPDLPERHIAAAQIR